MVDDVNNALFLFSFNSIRSLVATSLRASWVAVGTSFHDDREPELRTKVPESRLALLLGRSAAVHGCVYVCVRVCVCVYVSASCGVYVCGCLRVSYS